MIMKKVVVGIVLFFLSLQADYIVKYEMEGGEINTFYYKDDTHMKMALSSDICEGGELYKIKKKLYSVSYTDGQLYIMDLSKLVGLMNQAGIMSPEVDSEDVQSVADNYKIIKTSKSKKIGGVKAYKWILVDKETKEKYPMYVTKDKTAVKLTKAMYSMFSAMAQKGEEIDVEIEKGYVMVEGEGIKLLEIKKASLPASTYKLPNKRSPILKKCKKKIYHAPKKHQAEVELSEEETEEPSTPSSNGAQEELSPDDIQKAADMLKSFF